MAGDKADVSRRAFGKMTGLIERLSNYIDIRDGL
jgi:hypothetical protein